MYTATTNQLPTLPRALAEVISSARRIKSFGTTEVVDLKTGELVACTSDLCPEQVPERGLWGETDRANARVQLSPLAGKYINRAPFFWSGGLGTLIRRSAAPQRKDLLWAFYVRSTDSLSREPSDRALPAFTRRLVD